DFADTLNMAPRRDSRRHCFLRKSPHPKCLRAYALRCFDLPTGGGRIEFAISTLMKRSSLRVFLRFAEAFVEGLHDRIENIRSDGALAGLDLGGGDETRAQADAETGDAARGFLQVHFGMEDDIGALALLYRNGVGAKHVETPVKRTELLEGKRFQFHAHGIADLNEADVAR